MLPDVQMLVTALHDQPYRIMIVLAGAGSLALAWLLGQPGASRTLVEALVPYAGVALDDFLGRRPAQYVADETARQMAGLALKRAITLIAPSSSLIGLSCTATIVTDRPKRGAHRAYVTTWQPERIISYQLKLAKGTRNRKQEEEVVSRLILKAAARAAGVPQEIELNLSTHDSLTDRTLDLLALAQQLADGRPSSFGVSAEGEWLQPVDHPPVLFSGAFDPLHTGHLALASAAAAHLKQPLAFEVAARNADKPSLPPDKVLASMAQFAGFRSVYASNAPTFAEKAQLYPGATFVIGYDTAIRILQPRFYDDSKLAMISALARIQAQGCRFLVAGRLDDSGQFRTVADLQSPAQFAGLFVPLPEFRQDVSSTELRRTET